MGNYYEAHIVREDGSVWAGHTGSTPKEAEKKAREAQERTQVQSPPSHIQIYSCKHIGSHSWDVDLSK